MVVMGNQLCQLRLGGVARRLISPQNPPTYHERLRLLSFANAAASGEFVLLVVSWATGSRGVPWAQEEGTSGSHLVA